MNLYRKELYHHGVLGMKWGIRRYQNPDGSLTNAGRRRYGSDLDINDKSRKNIAKIRKGEALRRLDVAKNNNETNYTRIAELQGRVRSAKQAEKQAKRIDKGAKLAARGETITANNTKKVVGHAAAIAGTRILAKYTAKRIRDIEESRGGISMGHEVVGALSVAMASTALSSLAIANDIFQSNKNRNLRAFNNASRTGQTTIKGIGSTEYEDVVKRRKKQTAQ